VWLAQAHREVPAGTPAPWRARWAEQAARHRQGPPPVTMLDPDEVAVPETPAIAAANRTTAALALEHTLRVLEERAGA
ncbi:MAG: hypothetical protein WCK58_03455, partial [Chloroflexota bacterium]